MREFDEQVIFVDLDVCYGTGALVFNMQPRQTVVDALTQTGQLDEQLLDQYMLKFEEKLSILSAPSNLGVGYHINGEALDLVLNLLRNMADFVVLDVPHLWESWVPEILAGSDDVVLVCKPDLTNLRNAKNLLEYLGPKRENSAPTRLIFNQVGGSKSSDLTAKDFQSALAKEPSLSVPFDPDAFGRALNNGEVMSKASKKSKATKAIHELCMMVSDRDESTKGGKKGKKKGGVSLFKSKK
jgi:pilus assembly protein CpaE